MEKEKEKSLTSQNKEKFISNKTCNLIISAILFHS